ncbi:MAG: hypothetical protein FWG66_11300 [Spirochaetes bacterium]|nr:hypothetical protein [Spirochaetota bacterium]
MKKCFILAGLVLFVCTGLFAQNIDRVTRSGSTISVRFTNGNTHNHSLSSSQTYIGHGRDFVLVRDGRNRLITLGLSGGSIRQIATVADSFIEQSSNISVSGDTVTVTSGGSTRRYNRQLRL